MNPNPEMCKNCGKYPKGWQGNLCMICLRKADKSYKEAVLETVPQKLEELKKSWIELVVWAQENDIDLETLSYIE